MAPVRPEPVVAGQPRSVLNRIASRAAAAARWRAVRLARRMERAAKYERLAWARRAPLKTDTVLYESFSGNGMGCNPEAIFRTLLAADDMRHLKHVWVLDDFDRYAATIAEFADHPRVRFVKLNSIGYLRALASAKYLINNATFPPAFGKRDGQIYLNTWHGTPLKAMGYDVPGGATLTTNVVRNFASADFLLAPNERTADMYLSAYRMRNLFRGAIIAEGTPRIDKQFVTDERRAQLRASLVQRGVQVESGQRILLYAPTWRGDFYSPTNDVQELRRCVDSLSRKIDTSRYAVLLKVHQQVYKFAADDETLRPLLVPNEVPANDILAITDVLLTDYSSIFVDFLATGRPVLFYCPDLASYGRERGLGVGPEEWPGPVSTELDQLAAEINNLGTGTPDDPAVRHAGAYAAARERFCGSEDGRAAERVIDIVFRNKTAGYDVRTDFADGRASILIYLGGMVPNGITTSALNLLDNIDHDRFDVSVLYPQTELPERLALIDAINPRARLFARSGRLNGTRREVHAISTTANRTDRNSHDGDLDRYRDLLRAEYHRVFGQARFDYIVDFSGYSAYWNKFLLQGEPRSYSIWLHNDLAADAAQRPLHRANLEAIFTLYRFADHLVSVSPALAEVNARNLRHYAPAERFSYARNSINFQRILHLAYGVTDRSAQALDPAAAGAPADDAPVAEIRPLDLPGSVATLLRYHSIGDIMDEAERRATVERVLPARAGIRTFVTVGRISPEKNHARLIRAFDRVHQNEPNTRLVIIGDGPLLGQVTQLVAELGLTDAVILPGWLTNPFGVLAQCDCFVLSSDYEGQPMVLLEALVLGLPVVTTAFGSVRGALPEGHGLIVDRSVDALADGLLAFLRGEVSRKRFDYVAYNREATAEFYRAIGADGELRTPDPAPAGSDVAEAADARTS